MKINSHTKISALINHNKKSIDVIAAINPHFKKLKNPILRKVLAPRVTIKDAARIGKCDVEDFFNALSSIGFEIENQNSKDQKVLVENDNSAILEVLKTDKVKTLDVRPVLEGGADPFKNIMAEIKVLPEGYVLELINSFEPTPLIKILNKKGFTSWVQTKNNVIHTYFLKSGEEKKGSEIRNTVYNISLSELESKKEIFGDRCKELDVRELEMPLPMVTILNEIEELEEDWAIYVHHKKVPQYLLPELEERKVQTWVADIEDGNVKLLLHF